MTIRSVFSLLGCAAAGAALTLVLLAGFAAADAPDGGPVPALDGGPTDPGGVLPDGTLPDGDDALGWIRAGYDAIVDGDWKIAAGALLSLLVLGIRRYGTRLPGFFRTDRGGVVLVLVTSLIGGVGHAFVAGAPLSLALVESILLVAIIAIGGYQGLKRLIWPKPPAKPPAKPPGGATA